MFVCEQAATGLVTNIASFDLSTLLINQQHCSPSIALLFVCQEPLKVSLLHWLAGCNTVIRKIVVLTNK